MKCYFLLVVVFSQLKIILKTIQSSFCHVHKFDPTTVIHLTISYKTFLPGVIEDIPQLYRKYRSALWISERLNCSKRVSENFSCVQAYWPEKTGQISTDCKTLWTGKL